MLTPKKKIIFYFILFSLFLYFFISQFELEKDNSKILEPISINLLTSVHPSLQWSFKPVKSNISITPGEVTTIEYFVENLETQDTTGIASFVYYPKEFGNYITKINCFCYDAQTLKSKEKENFVLVLLIDPAVTKNSKTKNIKEATIQFTFFDYKKYKEMKN